MRIIENIYNGYESYSSDLQEQVKEVLQYTFQILEMKRLLAEIKKETPKLRSFFWTEEELIEKREAFRFFDTRMQAMVYYTLKNLDGYQQYGWKELIFEGENSDGTTDSIQKNQL